MATSPSIKDSSPRSTTVRVEGMCLGPYATNSYLVYVDGPDSTGKIWVIDPSFDPEPLIRRVRDLARAPSAIVLTHAHVDHIAGVDEVLEAFPGTPVVIHEAERDWLGNPMLNLGAMGGMMITARGPTRTIKEGETLEIDGSRWELLHTPGHSPGGITLVHRPSQTAIVGDTLFAGSIGRTDLPGGDLNTLESSIREKLYRLPDAMTIYPGHGPTSTIGAERGSNPFVRG